MDNKTQPSKTRKEEIMNWFKNLLLGNETRFPPELSSFEKVFLNVFCYPLLLLSSIYLIDQFCIGILKPCICCTYIAFGIINSIIIIRCLFHHKLLVHRARCEDKSEVDSLFVEADTVEPRLRDPEKPDDFNLKKEQLEKEVQRLKDLGEEAWTEYQVLSLNQLLVDFLKVDDLKARTLSTLEDLKEYADDRYDEKHYDDWKSRIDEAIKEISSDEKMNENDRDTKAEVLRAELRTLHEHVADYDKYWAEGSAVIRGLITCGVLSIPLLLSMGLLPILHPSGNNIISIYNWGLLGISGSVAAFLLNLHKSNLVDVGNTRGREELWRTVIGAALGLVAGILLYSMIAGGILSGSAFPSSQILIEIKGTSNDEQFFDLARSIFWGIASGFSFEWVFDKMRRVKEGEN